MKKKLTTHQATADVEIRNETLDGVEYIVAPVIAVREGVLNGELLTADEIGAFVEAWNGIPLPIGHPMDRGIPVSANRPDLIESVSVGRFFNATFDGTALKGEIWVDVEKARSLGGDALVALERLENGEPLEVSTAYFNDMEEGAGTFDGVEYNGIQRNLRPDHLALLPSDIGACSWEMGCGAPRVNSAKGGEKKTMWSKLKRLAANLFSLNEEISHDDIAQLLEAAMTEKTGDASSFWIKERFDDYFIYQENIDGGWGNGKLFKQYYTIDDEKNVTLGEQVEVEHIESYEPVSEAAEPQANKKRKGDQKNMSRNKKNKFRVNKRGVVRRIMKANALNEDQQAMVEEIVAGVEELLVDKVADLTQETVEEVVDDVAGDVPETVDETIIQEAESVAEDFVRQVVEEVVLDVVDQIDEEEPAANEEEEEEEDEPASNRKPKANKSCGCGGKTMNRSRKPATNSQNQNIDQWISAIPDPEMRQFMVNSRRQQQEHRAGLIRSLAANKRCAFDKSELQAMATNQLEKLARSLTVDDYSGVGVPRVNNYHTSNDDIPAPPSVVMALNKKGGK